MPIWIDMHCNKVRATISSPFVSGCGSNAGCSEYYYQCLPGGSGGNPPPATTQPSNPAPTGGTGGSGGLHSKFKAKGKLYFGTEIDHYHLNNNALTTIVKNNFGQVTCENSMKWDATERKSIHHAACHPMHSTKLTRSMQPPVDRSRSATPTPSSTSPSRTASSSGVTLSSGTPSCPSGFRTSATATH